MLTSYATPERSASPNFLEGQVAFSHPRLSNNRSVMPLDVRGCTRATLTGSACAYPTPAGAGNPLNPIRDGDRGLQLFPMNEEFPVSAGHKLDMLEKAHAQEAAIYLPVDEEAVAKTVSMMSGVPISNISQEEHAKLRQMRQTLKDIVIGQDDAIDKVVKAIQRNRLGLGSDKRPIGSFLFLGPTGVGKTYLAKKLAELLFDDEDALIRIDMSEYMESFNVSRLVGAAPGYVGYDEGGQLTEQVRRKPYSVVLFDELEKAHPDVYNILLQILDDGFITAADGTHVSFKNTVIILTSNIGTRQLKDFGAGVGFRQEVQLTQTEQEALLSKQLKKHFSPEFLNRLDETIYFASLEKEDIRKIVDVELRPIMARISEQGYNLVVTPSAKDKLADVGFDLEYGARPLRRALRHWIEDKLTDLILDGEANVGDTVRLRVSEGELLMEVDKRAPQKETQAKSDEATLGFALPSFTSSSQKGDER